MQCRMEVLQKCKVSIIGKLLVELITNSTVTILVLFFISIIIEHCVKFNDFLNKMLFCICNILQFCEIIHDLIFEK